MKASELIETLLKITQDAGEDLDVVTSYEAGFHDLLHPREPDFLNVYAVRTAPETLEENSEVIVIV